MWPLILATSTSIREITQTYAHTCQAYRPRILTIEIAERTLCAEEHVPGSISTVHQDTERWVWLGAAGTRVERQVFNPDR